MRRHASLRQATLLGAWSFLCVLPLLLKTGPNVVTLTYLEGAQRFYELGNPYLAPTAGRDYFFYPPFFAAIWRGFSWPGILPGILLWAFLNSFVFWWGVSCWFSVEKKQSRWAWFFLVCAAIELDISLRYQQANALLSGLILWALAEFRDRHFGRAGFLLALGTHLKVFPILIAAFLFLPFQLAFGASFVVSILVLFLVPASVVGVPEAFWLHIEQFKSTTSDFSRRQLLDLVAFFSRLGFRELGQIFQWATAAIGSLVLVFYRFRIPTGKASWGLWYSCFISMLLAVVPKTESPTFVWLAPAYLFCWQKAPRFRWLYASLAFAMTLVYSSVFPKAWVQLFTYDYNSKVLANFGFWILTSFLLIREMVVKRRSGPLN